MPLNFTIMNELQFHEGGQPIQLDDLQLLQENAMLMFQTLVKTLANEADVFLMKAPHASVRVAPDGSSSSYVVDAGTLVLHGDIIPWHETDMSVKAWNAPVYLCVREVESEPRVFADGQTRNCRIGKEVSLSLTKDGAPEAYSLFELPTLPDLLSKTLGVTKEDKEWQDVEVDAWGNGYSGTLRYRRVHDRFYFDINLTSNAEAWTESGHTSHRICDLNSLFVEKANFPGQLIIPLDATADSHERLLLFIRENFIELMIYTSNESSPRTLPLLARDKEAMK